MAVFLYMLCEFLCSPYWHGFVGQEEARLIGIGITFIVVPATCPLLTGQALEPIQQNEWLFMLAEFHANYDKLHPAVNQCMNVCAWCHAIDWWAIMGVFPPQIQFSQCSLLFYPNFD